MESGSPLTLPKTGSRITFVRSIFESRDKTFWIGTDGGGLNRFKDGRFRTYFERDGLSSRVVWSIYGERQEPSGWEPTAAACAGCEWQFPVMDGSRVFRTTHLSIYWTISTGSFG